MFRFNNRGLTLIELMMVVAIIAALSLFAIPAYKSYQSRARRVEGLNLLNTYYTAAIAAKAEYGVFPGNYVQTDFQPKGNLGYRFRAEDGTTVNIALNDDNCFQTAQACNCGGACPGFKTWIDDGSGAVGTNIGPTTVLINCPPLAPLSVTDNTFSVRVGAVVSLSAATPDRLGINEQKQIQVCQSGIH